MTTSIGFYFEYLKESEKVYQEELKKTLEHPSITEIIPIWTLTIHYSDGEVETTKYGSYGDLIADMETLICTKKALTVTIIPRQVF